MFTHDPYQNYAISGGYPGATPFGLPYSPYTALQNPGLNPAALSPLSGIPGYGGVHPQHLHAASILAIQAAIQQQLQNPLLAALYQNPLLTGGYQNPLTAHPLQNPFAAAVAQNPLLNPILAQTGIPTVPQMPLPPHMLHPQLAALQPQTWVGPGGLGVGQPFGGQPFGAQPFGAQPFGAIHPLLAQQLGARIGQTTGITPWGVY